MLRLDGPRVMPVQGRSPARLVILAHGYGSNGDDLISLAPLFAKDLPDAVFVAPNGPEPVPGYPGGFQWFPITRPDPAVMALGVQTSAATLDRFIDQELTRYRLAPADLALVGFSQGTMMALHVGLRRPVPLGAILGYSGTLAMPLSQRILHPPPVALVHGDEDDMIPVQALMSSVQGLAEQGVPSIWKICPRTGHTLSEEGIALGSRFLKAAFGGRLKGWAPPERVPGTKA